jgi:hypothetical protein
MYSIKSLALAVVVLFAASHSLCEWRSYAQERFERERGRTFDEEDLPPDSQTISPEDESANERGDEESPDATITEEEEFPERDSHAESAPPSTEELPSHASDHDAASGEDNTEESPEELPIATSGPPALPEARASGVEFCHSRSRGDGKRGCGPGSGSVRASD